MPCGLEAHEIGSGDNRLQRIDHAYSGDCHQQFVVASQRFLGLRGGFDVLFYFPYLGGKFLYELLHPFPGNRVGHGSQMVTVGSPGLYGKGAFVAQLSEFVDDGRRGLRRLQFLAVGVHIVRYETRIIPVCLVTPRCTGVLYIQRIKEYEREFLLMAPLGQRLRIDAGMLHRNDTALDFYFIGFQSFAHLLEAVGRIADPDVWERAHVGVPGVEGEVERVFRDVTTHEVLEVKEIFHNFARVNITLKSTESIQIL